MIKKFITILVLTGVLVVPMVVSAVDCPSGALGCERAIPASQAPCDCGQATTNGGQFCWAGDSQVFDSQAACQTAMASVDSGGAAPTEGMPQGLSPCTMRHDVKGCGNNCSEEGSAGDQCKLETCCLLDRVYTIADWMFVILLVLAGMFVIWAAFDFVISKGDPEKITSARNKITWALVGVIIAFLAQGLVRMITQIIAK